MKLWNLFKQESQKEQEQTPVFTSTDKVRIRYHFTGIVQNVGFRVEVWKRAKELGLTGYVENNDDGSVTSEIEGPKEKIEYLVDSMKKIPRINIQSIRQEQIQVKNDTTFKM